MSGSLSVCVSIWMSGSLSLVGIRLPHLYEYILVRTGGYTPKRGRAAAPAGGAPGVARRAGGHLDAFMRALPFATPVIGLLDILHLPPKRSKSRMWRMRVVTTVEPLGVASAT